MKFSRIFTLAIVILTSACGLFSFVSTTYAAATPAAPAADDSYGLADTAKQSGLSKYGSSVPVLAGSIIGTALSMISVIFFILMVYGGFLWMTAHGDEGTVTKAKETIIGAIIGIIIILASYAITNYVTTSVVSAPPAAPAAPAP